LIVIGGGVSEIGAPFFNRLREETKRRTMPLFYNGVRSEPAIMGNQSGMIGAALQLCEYGGEEL
jgi:glucokinase